MTQTKEKTKECGIYCNVIRIDKCSGCGKWFSYCVTHQRPTKHNRCTCASPSPEGAGARMDVTERDDRFAQE